MADGATTLVEEKPVTTSVGTKKSTKTGNLILDISHEVETMSKQKALQEAEKLAENVEVSYFKLGGILKASRPLMRSCSRPMGSRAAKPGT
jgi:hypothetical protein